MGACLLPSVQECSVRGFLLFHFRNPHFPFFLLFCRSIVYYVLFIVCYVFVICSCFFHSMLAHGLSRLTMPSLSLFVFPIGLRPLAAPKASCFSLNRDGCGSPQVEDSHLLLKSLRSRPRIESGTCCRSTPSFLRLCSSPRRTGCHSGRRCPSCCRPSSCFIMQVCSRMVLISEIALLISQFSVSLAQESFS